MVPMSAFDPQTEEASTPSVTACTAALWRAKKLSEMVEEELENMIRRREFAEGEQLPSERELMTFSTSGDLLCAKLWPR